ncbi:ATP-binding protein [Candidatus Latescibacterota bacterium]
MFKSIKSTELDALIQISHTINAHLDLDNVLESIMSVTTDVMKAEASSLFLIDDTTDELQFHIAYGEKANKIKSIRMKKNEGIVGSVIQNGNAEIVNDVTKDPRFFKKVDEESGFLTRSILCVPMKTTNRLLGAIEVLNKLDNSDFDDNDLKLCEAIAGQASIAIENAMLHKQIVKTERLAAIGQTIAGLAHCIKNVLNGIQGGSYMVDLGFRKDDTVKVKKGWEIIKKNNSFLQDLVLDMLTYSKDREPEYELVDINDIISSLCNLMEIKGKEKNVDISWTSNTSLKEVILDPKGIQRCLLNLISNAIDACAQNEDGHVNVSTNTINKHMFYISVSDNGCGISEENRSKLFQMFNSTKGSNGTGLGLVVTQKIIAEHGGEIKVESEVGKGTRFFIKLPLRKKNDISFHKSNSVSQI